MRFRLVVEERENNQRQLEESMSTLSTDSDHADVWSFVGSDDINPLSPCVVLQSLL